MPRLLLVLVALSATAVRAQPTAADSALADRLVAAVVPGEQARLRVVADDGSASGVEPVAFAFGDAVREAVLEDLRPGLLREALAVVEGPAYRRVTDAVRGWMRENGPQVALALLRPGAEAPGPMADSALAAAYVDAHAAATRPADVRRQSLLDAHAALPDSARARLEQSGILASMLAEDRPARALAQRIGWVRVARLQLHGVDPADVRAVTAYYASGAGRYAERRVAIGNARAALPATVQMLGQVADRTRGR